MCGFSIFSLKLVALPSLIYKFNGSGGLITALLLFLFDLFMITLFLIFKKKFPKVSIYEMFEKAVGKVISKIFYFLIMMFFVFKLILLLNEALSYIVDVVDEEQISFLFYLIIFAITNTFVYNGLRSFSRTAELFFPIVLIGLIVCLLLSDNTFAFEQIGPLFDRPVVDYLNTFFSTSFWFLDFVFVIVLADKIKVTSDPVKSIVSCALFYLALVMILYYAYYRLFTITSFLHNNAIADVTQFRRNIGNVGNVEIISILVFLFSMFFQAGLYFYCMCYLYGKIFNTTRIYQPIIIFDILVAFLSYFVFKNIQIIMDFSLRYLKYYSLIIWIIIPIFILIIYLMVRKKKNNGKNKVFSAKN